MSSSSILRWYLYSPPLKNQSLFKSFRHCMNWMFLYFRANKLIRIKVWVVEEEKPLLWPFYTHSNCASSIWSSLYAPREASSSILCKGLWLLNDSDGKKNESFYNSFNLEKSVVDQNVENVHRADQHLHDRVQMEFWPSSCHYEVTSLLKIWILDGHRITTREIRRFRVQQNLTKN